MPTFNGLVTDYVLGDDFSLRRTIDRSASGLESGVTITAAWFTVKTKVSDADVDALVQKSITTVDVSGTGQIENNGSGDVNPVIRFDVVPADTIAIGSTQRHYDIQVKTNGGKIYTPESGKIFGKPQITVSSS